MLLAFLISAGIGAVLLLTALIGRRVGETLYCRCGYCLEGLSEATACPECARPAWDPVNTRRGVRRIRRRRAVLGATLVLLFGGAWIAHRLAVPPGTNPYWWQPDWLLVRQPVGSDSALWSFEAEVTRRVQDGLMGPGSRAVLARRARSVLGAHAWNPGAPRTRADTWASLYGSLWQAGDVTDAQMIDLLERSIVCTAEHGSSQAVVYPPPPHLVDPNLVMVVLTGPLDAPAGGGAVGTSPALTIDTEFARPRGWGRRSGQNGSTLFVTLDTAQLGTQPRRLTLAMSFQSGASPPPTAAPGATPSMRYHILELDVPPLDPATNLPTGPIAVRHRFSDTNPIVEAERLWWQARNAENLRLLAEQRERAGQGRAAPTELPADSPP